MGEIVDAHLVAARQIQAESGGTLVSALAQLDEHPSRARTVRGLVIAGRMLRGGTLRV